jgi:hypothetical protein
MVRVDFDVIATDQIFCNCQILEKKLGFNGTVYQILRDFEKPYDSGRKHCTIFSFSLVYL